jgi:CheY-like chemotaxis protein
MDILIVDDEPAYRMLVTHYLEEQGWKVHAASEGEEGLNVLRETKIDFIISDVYMPVMDGIRFHKAVRTTPEYAQIPFLFVSGFDDEHTMAAARALKDTGFMRKARPMSELKEWIQYLATPADRRRPLPPGAEPSPSRLAPRGGRDDVKRR